MLAPQEHVSLQPFNTLSIPVEARFLVEINDPQEIPSCIDWSEAKSLPFLVLGGGSNIVLRNHFPGLVLLMRNHQMVKTGITDRSVTVSVGAGVVWQELVDWTLSNNFFGLENLTWIPGCVGAAPVQNIGAYGVELSNFLVSVTGFDSVDKNWRTLDLDACQLGYRDSIFKHALKDRFIITSIDLELSLTPQTETRYAELRRAFAECEPTPHAIEAMVRELRQRKLPDPSQIPNAGSFFKNPVVDKDQFETLQQQYPEIVSYQQSDGVKIAAGWLIDRAGWKGFSEGGVAVHDRQALVLTNPGRAEGTELLALAERIQLDILQCYGVELEIEPRVVE